MSFLDDLKSLVTGKKPEQSPAKEQSSAEVKPPQSEQQKLDAAGLQRKQRAAAEREKTPGPAERMIQNRFPDTGAVAKDVKLERDTYSALGLKPPREEAEKEPTKKENIFQPVGTRPGPTIGGGPGLGGGGSGGRTVERPREGSGQPEQTKPPTNADKMVNRLRRPPVQSFEQVNRDAGKDRGGMDR